ncbi:FAD/NAD(P)-binding protein [Pantoea trifolii]|uniref:FAD/NAD(P)-binding protein n=1 Tax=Pantoea trifolii TaxID=2968030 RepID=A0ABT1VQ11_9GAMM|nr:MULTISPECIES: FAD/NAD(P)-binding protein [unclassified Pantoea]MCQ8229630.1 FAD/NAD(P)-binding protein [Pantoea sp. MMK2]MCQ8239047.1 FAD/NAD(P)-binding protein [Pantoea sp. MMK3]
MATTQVIIVGGGFSGTALAIHLARTSSSRLLITVVEPRASLGGGVAYSTQEPAHRINVPASRMQLSGEEQGAFDRWYRQQPECSLDSVAHCEDGAVYPQRSLFGRYLADQFAQAAQAYPHVTLRHVQASAIGWEGEQLLLSNGETLRGDVLALAISHPPPSLPRALQPFSAHPALIANPWQHGVLDAIDPQSSVAIIGTGLSMADVVASLGTRQHRGPLIAFSRRGQLSRDNLSGEWPEWTLAPEDASSARLWLRHIRAEVARAAEQDLPWQRVLDQVRVQGQDIWQSLPLREQQRFVRHLRSWWDVHRYRIAPQVSAVINARRQQGSLKVLAARLCEISDLGKQLQITLRTRVGASETHRLDHLIVTTGPGHEALTASQPLLQSLSQQGLIRADLLGFGIDVDSQSRTLNLTGQPNARLFVVGPAARARFGELMGLPQVADHAAAVARHILQELQIAHAERCPPSAL